MKCNFTTLLRKRLQSYRLSLKYSHGLEHISIWSGYVVQVASNRAGLSCKCLRFVNIKKYQMVDLHISVLFHPARSTHKFQKCLNNSWATTVCCNMSKISQAEITTRQRLGRKLESYQQTNIFINIYV